MIGENAEISTSPNPISGAAALIAMAMTLMDDS